MQQPTNQKSTPVPQKQDRMITVLQHVLNNNMGNKLTQELANGCFASIYETHKSIVDDLNKQIAELQKTNNDIIWKTNKAI